VKLFSKRQVVVAESESKVKRRVEYSRVKSTVKRIESESEEHNNLKT
jgi:hypothetical protein